MRRAPGRDREDLAAQLAALEHYLEKARTVDRRYQLIALGAKCALDWAIRREAWTCPTSFLEMLALAENKKERQAKRQPVIVWLPPGVDADEARRVLEGAKVYLSRRR